MTDHTVVSPEEWIAARVELLKKEKLFTRQREELTRERLALPWVKVEKEYTFDTPTGKQSLADLFEGCHQLIVYHFMFGPDWQEGCQSCSMIADHYDPIVVHLRARDVALVTVSRAPLASLEAFKNRMGWRFPWVSSLENDFNWDFYVSFRQEDLDSDTAYYNYEQGAKFPVTEGPGLSSFIKSEDGQVFHTYSTYARGLEDFLGVYNFLDIVAKGRNEDELPYSMAWVRHHDRYGDVTFIDPYIEKLEK